MFKIRSKRRGNHADLLITLVSYVSHRSVSWHLILSRRLFLRVYFFLPPRASNSAFPVSLKIFFKEALRTNHHSKEPRSHFLHRDVKSTAGNVDDLFSPPIFFSSHLKWTAAPLPLVAGAGKLAQRFIAKQFNLYHSPFFALAEKMFPSFEQNLWTKGVYAVRFTCARTWVLVFRFHRIYTFSRRHRFPVLCLRAGFCQSEQRGVGCQLDRGDRLPGLERNGFVIDHFLNLTLNFLMAVPSINYFSVHEYFWLLRYVLCFI